MRLGLKWLLWFIIIGVYVMSLGGVFYYNLFKWTVDEKLKQEMIEKVKVYAPTLRGGLLKSAKAISFDEYDIMQSMMKDDRISSVLYLSRTGTVRWHKEARFIGIPWDEFQKDVPPPTDAINQAYRSKMPKVRQVQKQPFYEIAIPFSVRGEIIGIVDLIVSRAGAEMLIGSAMRKYVFGALGVIFLLGLPLYFFLHHYIISPLELLRDSIDNISLKTPNLRFKPRHDEIGEISSAIAMFLEKVKKEIEGISSKDKTYKSSEEKWWRMLLNTIMPLGQYVMVVDENNSILYANFELESGMDAKNVHLLDVIDSQQQNLLRIVGSAFEEPDKLIEGETVFRGENMSVKVMHISEASDISRTLILFSPKAQITV
ncbi:MAG: hypothetical protein KKD35_00300 [Elusimicrobia bacterium]|nr:hypothetical protein [Elusimicrobiota bacterium]